MQERKMLVWGLQCLTLGVGLSVVGSFFAVWLTMIGGAVGMLGIYLAYRSDAHPAFLSALACAMGALGCSILSFLSLPEWTAVPIQLGASILTLAEVRFVCKGAGTVAEGLGKPLLKPLGEAVWKNYTVAVGVNLGYWLLGTFWAAMPDKLGIALFYIALFLTVFAAAKYTTFLYYCWQAAKNAA